MPNIDDLFLIADNAGVRLEIVNGLPIWEPIPGLMHQTTNDRIRRSIKSRACLHYADLHIKFPDGSDKRPDVSIFCREPSETESAVTEVPEAVIEIISKGYEKKDLELGPPFYLKHGVKDVIVYDPYTRVTKHFDAFGEREYSGLVTLILHCGCEVTL